MINDSFRIVPKQIAGWSYLCLLQSLLMLFAGFASGTALYLQPDYVGR